MDQKNIEDRDVRIAERNSSELNTSIQDFNLTLHVNQSIEPQIIIPTRVKLNASIISLFRSFSFKGFGCCVSKSFVEWQTVGVGIRLPITANFPVYDSVMHLPRAGIFIGLFFPQCVARINFSMSIPVQTVLAALIKMLMTMLRKKKKQRLLDKALAAESAKIYSPANESNQKIVPTAKLASKRVKIDDVLITDKTLNYLIAMKKKMKVTDSVRRVGFTLSLKYALHMIMF